MSPLLILAAADAGPIGQIAKTFGANVPALIANTISFVLVALVLKKWAIGPIQATLEERRKTIALGLSNAAQAKSELAGAQQKSQELLVATGLQTTRIIEEARVAAAKLTEVEIQRAVTAAADIIAKAKQANEAELNRMRLELRKEVGRLVVAASIQVTGKMLTAEDRQRLAQETQQQFSA